VVISRGWTFPGPRSLQSTPWVQCPRRRRRSRAPAPLQAAPGRPGRTRRPRPPHRSPRGGL